MPLYIGHKFPDDGCKKMPFRFEELITGQVIGANDFDYPALVQMFNFS